MHSQHPDKGNSKGMLKQIQSLPANCHNWLLLCSGVHLYLLRFLLHTLDSQHAPIALHSQEPAASSPLICQPPVLWFNISHVITTVSYMFIHQSPCANFSHPDPCKMTHLKAAVSKYDMLLGNQYRDGKWYELSDADSGGYSFKGRGMSTNQNWWFHGSISGCSCTSSHNYHLTI